jgi:hypothetical protein
VSPTTTTSTAGGVLGSTGAGGGTGGKVNKGNKSANNGNVAGNAQTANGGLPFTGLHAPLLVLIGLGMAVAGFGLRRRLDNPA